MFRVILFLVIAISMVFIPQREIYSASLLKKAISTGDYLRVRESPTVDSVVKGMLYKNMVFQVLERSIDDTEIKGESHSWYRIKYKELEGWSYGKFISFTIPAGSIDTYASTGDMTWFYKRFGYSSWYENHKPTAKSFSLDEYRALMKAAEKGDNQAWQVLHLTIYPHLKNRPNDQAYIYLKKKLYSKKFLLTAFEKSYYIDGSFKNLPDSILSDWSFYNKLRNSKAPYIKWAIKRYPVEKLRNK